MAGKAHSFWEDDYGPYEANPPLEGSHRADVIVLGAGYTGLTAAREIMRDSPNARVMVLEARHVGFGASGRNAGFSMSLFGMEPELTKLRWGGERTHAAQAYMEKAIAYVRALSEENALDNDYQHTGMMRVAYSPKQLQRLEKTFQLLDHMAPGRFVWEDAAAVQRRVNSPRMMGGFYESDTGILNPCKHVRSLKRLAEAAGAEIYENTRATSIERSGSGVTVEYDGGTLQADRLVVALNAWSHLLQAPRRLHSRQRPVWTSQIVTEPLSAAQWDEVNWAARESIEDNRQLVHYLRRTVCGRITLGGGNIAVPKPAQMPWMDTEGMWRALEKHLRWLFPPLKDVGIAYRWGGAVSVNMDVTPEVGFLGDERIIHASGCIGHGVSITQLNGRMIADLVAGKDTELTDFWILNRRAVPYPLTPVDRIMARAGTKVFQMWDAYEERGLPR